jgi:hypothetical protein
LRVLNPIVRDPKALSDANETERIEYAVLLTRLGAIFEARTLFEAVDKRRFPEVLLFQTFTLTPEWRYAETIEPLETFVSLSEDRPYLRLIAKVNLVAALIFCRRFDEAEVLLESSREDAFRQEAWFLLGSLFELAAQLALAEGRFDAAELSLHEAADLLRKTSSMEGFFVEKWNAILEFSRDPSSSRAQELMRGLRRQALLRRDWETVRDFDYHSLRGSPNQTLFNHIYCGSPSKSFRERLLRTFPGLAQPLPVYKWRLSGDPCPPRLEIDVQSGRRGGLAFVESGQAPHRLLILLSRDFYRAGEGAYLASQIFPDEHYHPVYTPMKMSQILSRLRNHLSESKIPLRILVRGGQFSLRGIRDCTVIKDCRFDHSPPNPLIIEIRPLIVRFGRKRFSAKEAALVLNCSLSTASRKLKSALELGVCVQHGSGKLTKFQLSEIETSAETRLVAAS